MKITNKEELKLYLANLYAINYSEFESLDTEVRNEGTKISDTNYIRNQKSYKKQKAKLEDNSIILFKKVKVGDVVQMHGTNDGEGYRKILKIVDNGLQCRKLKLVPRSKWLGDLPTLTEEPYITSHMNTKLKRIVDFYVNITV